MTNNSDNQTANLFGDNLSEQMQHFLQHQLHVDSNSNNSGSCSGSGRSHLYEMSSSELSSIDDAIANTRHSSSSSQQQQQRHVTKLFVGNLPTSTTLPELLAVFKKYGPVNEKLSVVKDQNYAFIHFYNRKDAQVALREVNDSLFKDRYIRVQFSTSQGYTNSNKSKSKLSISSTTKPN